MIEELYVVDHQRCASRTKLGCCLSVSVRTRSNRVIVHPNCFGDDSCGDFNWDVGHDLWTTCQNPARMTFAPVSIIDTISATLAGYSSRGSRVSVIPNVIRFLKWADCHRTTQTALMSSLSGTPIRCDVKSRFRVLGYGGCMKNTRVLRANDGDHRDAANPSTI
jgi:hypothetical protein